MLVLALALVSPNLAVAPPLLGACELSAREDLDQLAHFVLQLVHLAGEVLDRWLALCILVPISLTLLVVALLLSCLAPPLVLVSLE